MAFPWISHVNFEDGTLGDFDTETDTQPKLDFPHYSELARTPGIAMPFTGAYCMRVDLSVGTTDAYVVEGGWNIAASGNQFWRFMLWLDPNLTMANDNQFTIFSLLATATTEAVCAIQFTTDNGFRIGIGETAATSFLPITLGEWHAVEIEVTIDDGPSDDGVIDLWLDGAQATQVGSLNQGAITDGRVGVQGVDAGTTRGIILFDDLISDDARIYPPVNRFDESVLMTKDGHAFVGPGIIGNLSLKSGAGTDNVVSIFDTDVASTLDAGNIVTELKNTANNELVDPAGMPVEVRRGAYVVMTGTNPRSLVQIDRANAWGGDGAIRNYALRRTETPRAV